MPSFAKYDHSVLLYSHRFPGYDLCDWAENFFVTGSEIAAEARIQKSCVRSQELQTRVPGTNLFSSGGCVGTSQGEGSIPMPPASWMRGVSRVWGLGLWLAPACHCLPEVGTGSAAQQGAPAPPPPGSSMVFLPLGSSSWAPGLPPTPGLLGLPVPVVSSLRCLCRDPLFFGYQDSCQASCSDVPPPAPSSWSASPGGPGNTWSQQRVGVPGSGYNLAGVLRKWTCPAGAPPSPSLRGGWGGTQVPLCPALHPSAMNLASARHLPAAPTPAQGLEEFLSLEFLPLEASCLPHGGQCPLRPEPHVAPCPRCRLPPLRPPRPWVVPDTAGPRLACGCVCYQPFRQDPLLPGTWRSVPSGKGPQSSSVSSVTWGVQVSLWWSSVFLRELSGLTSEMLPGWISERGNSEGQWCCDHGLQGWEGGGQWCCDHGLRGGREVGCPQWGSFRAWRRPDSRPTECPAGPAAEGRGEDSQTTSLLRVPQSWRVGRWSTTAVRVCLLIQPLQAFWDDTVSLFVSMIQTLYHCCGLDYLALSMDLCFLIFTGKVHYWRIYIFVFLLWEKIMGK